MSMFNIPKRLICPNPKAQLSFSMARSAILEFIFPRCYFPVPTNRYVNVRGKVVCPYHRQKKIEKERRED